MQREEIIGYGIMMAGSHTDEVLPDEIEARSHLEESFGYSVFEEIQETCCQKVVKVSEY